MLFIRPHVSEDWVGKLSESHGFSQRYVVGYEDCCGLGGRVRYWNYNDHVPVLDPSCIDFDMGVLDLEITNRFCFRSTELVVAGGFRYASWGMTDATQYEVDLDAYGLTMAADFSTLIACYGCSQWSFVYGGRLSILGGSWEGDNYIIDTIVTPEVRDDNLLVHELHVGVELPRCPSGRRIRSGSLGRGCTWAFGSSASGCNEKADTPLVALDGATSCFGGTWPFFWWGWTFRRIPPFSQRDAAIAEVRFRVRLASRGASPN
jgi:hypothetical protein